MAEIYYRVFVPNTNKKKIYVKDSLGGFDRNTLDLNTKKAGLEQAMFSEDEINRYGLGECSREHVVGKKEFIDGVYNKYKDHEQQMFVVFATGSNSRQCVYENKDGMLDVAGVDSDVYKTEKVCFTIDEIKNLKLGRNKRVAINSEAYRIILNYDETQYKLSARHRLSNQRYMDTHTYTVAYSRAKAGAKAFATLSGKKFVESVENFGKERYINDLKQLRKWIDETLEKIDK